MKRILCAIIAILLMQTMVFANGTELNDLRFEPAVGGKFIYCNNREELIRADLADDGDNPSYIMNNSGLTADNYRLFITHFNRIHKQDGEAKYSGENIWLDAVFAAQTDCEIELDRTAFEIPAKNVKYLGYETILTEDSWSSIAASAQLMGKEILQLDTGKVFKPDAAESINLQIKKGDRVFLSDYMPEYASIPYPKHALMAADFTIKYGTVNLDIFAARKRTQNNNETMYPNVDFDTCGYGAYKRDRTIKGIADSWPEMRADLEFAIDDSTRDGTALPVKIYNQYFPDGNNVTAWVTNLNPQGDTYSRNLNAEDSILTFKYKDPGKKEYYGENVPENKRDDVWIFDTHHSDTAEYFDGTGFKQEDYIPNFEIEPSAGSSEYSCNLGNYGVTLRYNLAVANNGEKDRYFDYTVTTAANVIIEAEDENGEPLAPVIARGQTGEATCDTMASILLPAGVTTRFSLGITLPVQNFGGQRQSFIINSSKTEIGEKPQKKFVMPVLAQEDITEKYGIKELLENSDEHTKWVFDGNLDDFCVVKTDFGYAAYDAEPAYGAYGYWYYWDKAGRVFLLDEDFSIIDEKYFGSQPIEMTYSGGKLYIKTIANGSFCLDESFEEEAFDGFILPRESTYGWQLWAKDGILKACAPDSEFYDIAYQGLMPPFFDEKDGIFYYASENTAGASYDGINWSSAQTGNIESVRITKDGISAEGEEVFAPDINLPKIRVNSEYLGFDTLPKVEDGRILVPVRFILEKLGMRVIFNQEQDTVTAVSGNGLIKFALDSNTAFVNGQRKELDVPAKTIGGRTYVPLRFLSENIGCGVEWDAENGIAVIEGKIPDMIGELEISGDISAVMLENDVADGINEDD